MRKALLLILLLCAGVAQAQIPTATGNALLRIEEGNNTWKATLNQLLAGRVGPDSTWAKTAAGYTGKRITDPVYRFAPFGVGSTDTVGRINLLGVGTTKAGIYARYLDASTNGYNFFRVDPDNQTNNSTVGSFTFWATNFDGVNSPYSSRANHVWRFGYNTAAGGGREINGDADLHIAFESNFYNVYTTGRRKRSWEWHLQSQDTLDGVHRMISAIAAHDGKDGEISFSTNRFTLNPYSISGPWLDMDYVNKNTYIDTMRWYFNTPQVGHPFFSFRNVANSAYVKMFEQGSADELIISSQGNITQLGGNLKMPASGVIYTADNSPLLIGNTSNKNGLTIFSATDEVLRLKSANETTGWNLRAEASDFVLQNPAGNGPLYISETAPHLSMVMEASTGDVGFQINAPTARLHTYTTSGATYPGFRQENSTGNNALYRSNASPDGAITANPGDVAQTGISSLGGLWVKETGTGNTGWAKTLTSWQVTKAVPTTTNATQEVGVITHNAGGRSTLVQIDAVVAASGFAMQKRYVVPLGFNSTGGSWNILVPTEASENSGWAGSNNFNLEMRTNTSGSPSGGIDTIRITRIAGSTSANCVLTIQVLSGDANTTFTALSATGTSSTTTLYAQQAIAQINNKVGINDIAPDEALDVNGKVRVQTLTNTPTTLIGRDGSKILGDMAVSSELAIASGTLKLAQQGASSGQVLEWNGSAWAPATDDGGAGATDHGALTGLSDDDHTQYALLAGRSGGQTLTGGTGSGDDITLRSTTNATKGDVILNDQGGNVTVGGGATASELRMLEPSGSGTNYTGFKAAAMSGDRILTLPTDTPSDGDVLGWHTGDLLSWDAAGGSSYYQTLKDEGVAATQRAAENYVPGVNSTPVLTDDSGNNETEVKVDVLAGSISPSQLTSDQDNWNPTNWSTNTTARVSGDATIRAITGFSALADGTVRRLVNTGGSPLYIPSEHPDSDAGNRVAGYGDNILAANGGVIEMYYDGTSSRWRITRNSYNAADMMSSGSIGHFFQASVGATTGGDWGHIGFGLSGGANGVAVPTPTAPSGWSLTTSTSATGAASLYFSKNVSNPTELGSAHLVTSFVVSFTTLSDGTNTYTFSGGITSSASSLTLNLNNSITVQYTHGTNSGKFLLVSRDNAGSQSTADLGLTVSAGAVYVVTVCYDKARSEGRAYVAEKGSGTLYSARVTGNMPNAGDAGSRVVIVKSAGTTSRDAIIANYSFNTIY